MSKNHIRKDKTCLNCYYVVENKFCPNCGQENSETRKSFHHLFLHFFEDLTHYENAFWKTIKNLLFKPAFLSKEYLIGKRLAYLAPVRLYIFISFITFFLLAILPNEEIKHVNKKEDLNVNKVVTHFTKKDSKNLLPKKNSLEQKLATNSLKKNTLSDKEKIDIKENLEKSKEKENSDFFLNSEYKSVRELDSVQKLSKTANKLSFLEYWIEKKMITIKDNNTKEELIEKSKESALHNFPKVIVLYMPLFALFLWLFHSKKKWFYFDHGIFTLHYFSFLLLILLLTSLVNFIFNLFPDSYFFNAINTLLNIVGYSWIFLYFFPAHYRFYGEGKTKSIIKSITLYFINTFFIMLFLFLFVIYTLLSIH